MLNRQVPWPLRTIAVQLYWSSLLSLLPWLFETLPTAWSAGDASRWHIAWCGFFALWFTLCYVLWAARLQERKSRTNYSYRDLLADAIDVVTVVGLFLIPVLDPRSSSADTNIIASVLLLSAAPSLSNLVAYGVINSRYGGLPEIAAGISLCGAAYAWLSPLEATSVGWFVLYDLTLLLVAYEASIVDWS